MARLSCLCLVLVCGSTAASAQVVDISPRGGLVQQLAASPRNPALSTLGLPDGQVLRSNDAGATYLTSTLPALPDLVELDWDFGGFAYAMTPSTLWVSVDGALTWLARAYPGSSAIGFAASQLTPGRLYAVDASGGLYRSGDAGQSWLLTTPPGVSNALGVALDPTQAGRLVVYGEMALAISDDFGDTWQLRDSPNPTKFVALAGGRIHLHAEFFYFPGFREEILTSDDLGVSWELRTSTEHSTPKSTLALDPRNPGTLYFAGNGFGFSESTDNGTTWSTQRTVPNGFAVTDIAFPGAQGPQVLFGTSYGVLRTSSLTEPFGLASGDLEPLDTRGIQRDPTDPDHLAAATLLNPIQSFDGGLSWEEYGLTLDGGFYGYELEFDRSGALYLVTNFEEVSRYEDGVLDEFPGFGVFSTIVDLDVGERDPDLIVTIQYNLPTQTLTYSQDRGATWNSEPMCLDFGAFTECRPDLYDVEIIERPGHGPRVAVIAEVQGWRLVYSDDLGQTWTVAESTADLGVNVPLISMAESRRTPGEFIVGFGDGRPVHVSYDGLETLVPAGNPQMVGDVAIGGLAQELMVRTVRGSMLDKVEESLDGGQTWSEVFSIPTSVNGYRAIEVGVNSNDYLVCGNFGAFRRIVSPEVSTLDCTQPVPNSLGLDALLTGNGSASINAMDVQLDIELLPQGVPVLFLASEAAGLVQSPGGSMGNLCLGGAIGRFSSVQFSGIAGAVSLPIDPQALPQPNGTLAATAGSPWFFQAWYRDNVGGLPTSNFTNSIQILWQ